MFGNPPPICLSVFGPVKYWLAPHFVLYHDYEDSFIQTRLGFLHFISVVVSTVNITPFPFCLLPSVHLWLFWMDPTLTSGSSKEDVELYVLN